MDIFETDVAKKYIEEDNQYFEYFNLDKINNVITQKKSFKKQRSSLGKVDTSKLLTYVFLSQSSYGLLSKKTSSVYGA